MSWLKDNSDLIAVVAIAILLTIRTPAVQFPTFSANPELPQRVLTEVLQPIVFALR